VVRNPAKGILEFAYFLKIGSSGSFLFVDAVFSGWDKNFLLDITLSIKQFEMVMDKSTAEKIMPIRVNARQATISRKQKLDG